MPSPVHLFRLSSGKNGHSMDQTHGDFEALAGAELTLLPNQLGDYAIFDVSDSIQSFVNGTATNFGWLINPGGADGWRFRSSELVTIGDRPRLEITYMMVPEPSSLALGVLGAVAVACWLCRNRLKPRPRAAAPVNA